VARAVLQGPEGNDQSQCVIEDEEGDGLDDKETGIRKVESDVLGVKR
jgi:hypothetical protein